MKKVSPITAKPLRQAGESLRQALDDLFYDKLLFLLLTVVIAWAIAWAEWSQYLRSAKPNPVLYTFIATLLTVYAVVRGYFVLRKAKRLKLGLHGEQAVGEYLSRLAAKGFRVFHDLPFPKGNIDHVILCTRGVFVIETKTRSKPATGDVCIWFDGESIAFDQGKPDEKPIRQVRAQAANLKTLLKEETGFDYPIRPVVVLPGWYVERLPPAIKSEVWVLNPKALHKWIDNEPQSIDSARVKLAATKVGKYIRTH